jgi:hypothetical protein
MNITNDFNGWKLHDRMISEVLKFFLLLHFIICNSEMLSFLLAIAFRVTYYDKIHHILNNTLPHTVCKLANRSIFQKEKLAELRIIKPLSYEHL